MRLFAASIATETNTYSPIPTSFANFEDAFHAPPGQHPDEAKLCTAPLYVARRRAAQEGFTLIEGSCFWAEPSGTCRRADFEMMRDRILSELQAAMPVDGVLLGLHGAFVADGYDDAEGDLLERVRAIVGPKAAIGCEYDPHCHMTEKRVRLADIGVLFKEYPHVDFIERGEEVVTLVLKTLRGEIKPVASLYDPRMWDFYPTTIEPMRSFVDRIKALEGKDGVLSVSIAHGFMHADVADMGSRVLVYTDGRKAAGDRLAQTLGQELWANRGKWCPPIVPLDEALTRALAHRGGCAIIAEPADNAGGGAASDNTLSLHELRRRGVENAAVAPVWDPVAVSFCHAAGVGARLPLRFGGKASADSGLPVDADVEVRALATDTWQSFGQARVPVGDMAAVRVDGNIDVILIAKRTQALGRELFTHMGLDPGAYRLLVLKSAQHFAGAYGPLASLILRADTGGACPPDLRRHVYTKLKRPMWPLDETVEGRLVL
ncbi:MAG: M81 family metallopeptidase [Hyphomicrobiaceae bacterium]